MRANISLIGAALLALALQNALPAEASGNCEFGFPAAVSFTEIFGDLKDESWPSCFSSDLPCTCNELSPIAFCGDPIISRQYELSDPLCDPNSTSCIVKATIHVVQPGIEDGEDITEQPTTPLVFWWEQFAKAPTCSHTTCDNTTGIICGSVNTPGGRIRSDTYEMNRFFGGVTCSNSLGKLESARLFVCPSSSGCVTSFALDGIGGKDMAASIGCPIPIPMDDGACELSAGGDGSVAVGGGGPRKTIHGSGPGALLSYYAGGAGGVGLPGSTNWNVGLGPALVARLRRADCDRSRLHPCMVDY